MCNELYLLPDQGNWFTQYFLKGKDFFGHVESTELTAPLRLMSRSPPIRRSVFCLKEDCYILF